MGDGSYGIDPATANRIANEIKSVTDLGAEVCLVIGGGNIFRGISGAAAGLERGTADYMGMLATVMNALAMQGALEDIGVPTRVQSAIPMAALRATEMNCDAIFKGTQVDGVYSADPHKVPDAERYETLTYMDVLSRDLRVMDASAISLARENNIPILVFSIHNPNAFAAVVQGEGTFTIISDEG